MSIERMRDIEKRLRHIEVLLAKLPVRVKPGGGSSTTPDSELFHIDVVTSLPAIPTGDDPVIVFWTSVGGTGDDQLWSAYKTDTRWYPISGKWTDKTGIPV